MTVEELFNENVPLAHWIANTYKDNYPDVLDDIKQESLIGLWKACINYNGTTKFSTFACPCIYNGINMYLRTYNKHKIHDISMYTPIKNSVSNELYLADVLEYKNNDIDDILDEMEMKEYMNDINDIFTNLDILNRNKNIFVLYLNGQTQMNLSKQFNLSQCQISRIVNDMSNRIKISLEEKCNGK